MTSVNWMNLSRDAVTTDITFADNTHTTSSGIKIQDLAYKNQKLVIQTPKTMTPFGISKQYKSEDKFEITLQLEENNALHEQFQRMLKAIEASVVEYIFLTIKKSWASLAKVLKLLQINCHLALNKARNMANLSAQKWKRRMGFSKL